MNRFFLLSLTGLFIFSAGAQKALTTKDYQQAESMLSYNVQKYVDHSPAAPSWLPGDRFWYRTLTPEGSEFILVDAAKGKRVAAFDQQKLAAAISKATGKQVNASMMPFTFFNFS